MSKIDPKKYWGRGPLSGWPPWRPSGTPRGSPRRLRIPKWTQMSPKIAQDRCREALNGPRSALWTSISQAFSRCFLKVRVSTPKTAAETARDRRWSVETWIFEKTSRKRLRNARPEGPNKPQMSPKMAQNGPRRNSKAPQNRSRGTPQWTTRRGVGGMSEALK